MPGKTKGRTGRPSNSTSEGTPLDRLRLAAGVRVGDPIAKAVWMELARHTDDRWRGFVGQSTIATTLELGESTVRRKVAHIEQLGLMSRERRWKRNGARLSDLYTLHVAVPLDASGRERHHLPLDDDRAYRSLRSYKSQKEESASPPLPVKGQSAPAREEDLPPQDDLSSAPQLDDLSAETSPDVKGKRQEALPLAPSGTPEELHMAPWDLLVKVFTLEQLYVLGFEFTMSDPPTLLGAPEGWHGDRLNGHARDPLFRTTLRRQAERVRTGMEAA